MGWCLPDGCSDGDIDRAAPGYWDDPEPDEPEPVDWPILPVIERINVTVARVAVPEFDQQIEEALFGNAH